MPEINKEKQAAIPQKLLKELLDYNGLTGGWFWLVSPNRKIKVGQPAGSVRKDGYITIKINSDARLAHRLAWTYVYGDYPNGEQPYIDHINGNPSDNRITNLRVNSHGENMKNKQMMSNNTSGVVGVTRHENKSSSGKIHAYWMAFWNDENGKRRSKNFPVNTYGEEVAKQMAIVYRVKQICLLELKYNVTYSERHGT